MSHDDLCVYASGVRERTGEIIANFFPFHVGGCVCVFCVLETYISPRGFSHLLYISSSVVTYSYVCCCAETLFSLSTSCRRCRCGMLLLLFSVAFLLSSSSAEAPFARGAAFCFLFLFFSELSKGIFAADLRMARAYSIRIRGTFYIETSCVCVYCVCVERVSSSRKCVCVCVSKVHML